MGVAAALVARSDRVRPFQSRNTLPPLVTVARSPSLNILAITWVSSAEYGAPTTRGMLIFAEPTLVALEVFCASTPEDASVKNSTNLYTYFRIKSSPIVRSIIAAWRSDADRTSPSCCGSNLPTQLLVTTPLASYASMVGVPLRPAAAKYDEFTEVALASPLSEMYDLASTDTPASVTATSNANPASEREQKPLMKNDSLSKTCRVGETNSHHLSLSRIGRIGATENPSMRCLAWKLLTTRMEDASLNAGEPTPCDP